LRQPIEAFAQGLIVTLDESIGVQDEQAAGGERCLSWFGVTAADPCCQRGQATVFEVSPVLVGANRNTRTLAIKGQERIDEQSGRVRADLHEYIARELSLADLRAKEGRALSTQRRTRLEQMRDVLTGGLEELNRLLDETTPRTSGDEPEDGEAAKALAQTYAAYLASVARDLGVEV